MKTKELKAILLNHFRYNVQRYIATEVTLAKGIADVVMLGQDNKSYEIETKISIADLKNEYKAATKIKKHTSYQSAKVGRNKPNYFYFAVPEAIAEKALLYIKENSNDKYGVIVVNDQHEVTVKRKAKRLNKSLNDQLRHTLFMRASSELTTLRIKEAGIRIRSKYTR